MARTHDVWQTGTGGGYIETISPIGYDILINGTNKYLNFGTVSGTSGYGFRDNAGTMEFKNSAGSWAAFGSGGGSQTPWTSNIDGANYQLNNLGEPSAVTDGATRGYVDNHFKVFVTTYNNGSVNNINLASAPAVIDTITLTVGDTVLVAAQTSSIDNGIYTFNGAGVAMTRTTGFTDDTSLRASIIQVNRGGANGRRTFANTNNFAITVGVTSITYGPLYNPGTGISFTGANTINLTNTGTPTGTFGSLSTVGFFTVDAQGRITSAGSVGILITSGQVSDFTSAVLAIVPPNVITRGRVVALARRI